MRLTSDTASRMLGAAAISATTATALVSVTVLRHARQLIVGTPAGGDVNPAPGWLQILIVITSVSGLAAMWRSASRPHIAAGFAVMLTGWLATDWADSPSLTPRLRVVAAFLWPLTTAGLAVVVLRWGHPPDRTSRRLLVVIVVASTGAAAVGPLSYNPFDDPRCSNVCGHVPAPLGWLVTTGQAIVLCGLLALCGGVALFVGLLRTRPRYLAGAAAVANTPVVWIALSAVNGRSEFGTLSRTVTAVGAGIFGAAVLWAVARTAQTRRAVECVVTDLVAGSGAPSVLFALAGEAGWIDTDGCPVVVVPDDRRWLVIDGADGPGIRIRVGSGPDDNTALERMSGATRLVLENARLAAIGRARVRAVQASQQRIVATFDDERRRIERDLHDGAQQRLVSVAFQLSAARARVGPAALAHAEASVREALEALRDVSHGVFPSALAQEGIAAALEDLVSATGASVTLDADLEAGIDWHAATATYTVAAYVLTRARSRASIRVRREAATVRLQARILDGTTPDDDLALGDVRDRLGAIGGTLDVRYNGLHELELDAVIPCASS